MTVVTRQLWRHVINGKPQGTYFDMLTISPPLNQYALYTFEHVAEPSPFPQIEAHTELGGYALALREGVVYAVFTEQDGPGFAELWSDVSYHLIVSITEDNDGK